MNDLVVRARLRNVGVDGAGQSRKVKSGKSGSEPQIRNFDQGERASYHRFQHEADQWLFGPDKAALWAASPATAPKSLRGPVFIAANPDIYQHHWSDPKTSRRKLTAAGNPPIFVKVTAGINVAGTE